MSKDVIIFQFYGYAPTNGEGMEKAADLFRRQSKRQRHSGYPVEQCGVCSHFLHIVLSTEQVVHIGDSLSSDVKAASMVGISAVWINRSGREVPEGVTAVENLLEVYNMDYLK